jgi:hypothetical protein
MSSAFVPGRILRAALWSRLLKSFCCSALADTGDSWSSGIGGGLGKRGEAGDAISVRSARLYVGRGRRVVLRECCRWRLSVVEIASSLRRRVTTGRQGDRGLSA